eukprot:Sspe_Gene.106039::Locus_83190_Transcript_1_1_Confidence_1.000_Length_1837::g.106039::m.106039
MNLGQLNGSLSGRPYVAGYTPSAADREALDALLGGREEALRWCADMVQHIRSGVKGREGGGPAPPPTDPSPADLLAPAFPGAKRIEAWGAKVKSRPLAGGLWIDEWKEAMFADSVGRGVEGAERGCPPWSGMAPSKEGVGLGIPVSTPPAPCRNCDEGVRYREGNCVACGEYRCGECAPPQVTTPRCPFCRRLLKELRGAVHDTGFTLPPSISMALAQSPEELVRPYVLLTAEGVAPPLPTFCDVVGQVANVMYRVVSYISKKLDGRQPTFHPGAVHAALRAKVSEGTVVGWFEGLLALNEYLNLTAPWKIIKTNPEAACQTLGLAADVVRGAAETGLRWYPVLCHRVLACFPGGEVVAAPPDIFFKKPELPPSPFNYPLIFTKAKEAWPCVVIEFSNLTIPRRSAECDRWKEGVRFPASPQPHVATFKQTLALRCNTSLVHSVDNLRGLWESGGKLPDINVLVDIYNTISLRDGLVMGAYDERGTRDGRIFYGPASGDEHFVPLGRTEAVPVQAGEHLVKDADGNVITTFCKQSVSSAVTLTTRRCFLMVWGNPDTSLALLRNAASDICNPVLRFCGPSATASVLHEG